MRVAYLPYPNIFPATSEPILIEIDARIIPVVISATERYKSRNFWSSDEDWKDGVQALNTVQESLLTGTQSITEAIDRVYRLLDTSLNGVSYTATPDPSDNDVMIVTPELPAAPADISPALMPANALRKRFERLVNLTDSSVTGATYSIDPSSLSNGALSDDESVRKTLREMQGQINAGWFGIGGQDATIADIVSALRIGTQAQKQNILETLNDILGAGGNSAAIFNAVAGLLGDTVDTVSDGAVLGTLIASTIANAAMLGTLAGQIDRIISTLDGGGLTGPEGNVLDTLKSVDGTLDSVEILLS